MTTHNIKGRRHRIRTRASIAAKIAQAPSRRRWEARSAMYYVMPGHPSLGTGSRRFAAEAESCRGPRPWLSDGSKYIRPNARFMKSLFALIGFAVLGSCTTGTTGSTDTTGTTRTDTVSTTGTPEPGEAAAVETWHPMMADAETDEFTLHAGILSFKPGIKVERDNSPGGGVIYRLNNGSGGYSIKCRCPAGYTGSCTGEVDPGSSTASCSGTCDHSEVVGLTAPCGWFASSSASGLRYLRTRGATR